MFLCFICMPFSDLIMLSICAGITRSFQQNTSEAQSTPFKSSPAMPQSNSPFTLSPASASKPSFNWSGNKSNSIASYAEESAPSQSKDTKTPTVFEQTEKKAGGVKLSEGKANMFPDRAAGSAQRLTGAPASSFPVQSLFGSNSSSSISGNKLTFPAAAVSVSSSPLSSTSLDSVSPLPKPSSRSLPSSTKDSGIYSLSCVYFVWLRYIQL